MSDMFFGVPAKDITLNRDAPKQLDLVSHFNFIKNYMTDEKSYEFITSEYLRLSGLYWCLTAMDIMGKLGTLDQSRIAKLVRSCQQPSGGFAPAVDHDAHLLHTLSAVQIMTMLNRINEVDVNAVVNYVAARQNDDGSFSGDEHGENKLDAVNVESAATFILRCYNYDGGFGTRPGSESHAGQVYCCVGALAILGRLEDMDVDRTGRWLAERQCCSGGLNGRPEKLPDVCYSWWVLASLAIVDRIEWIDEEAIKRFIYACQDSDGGFSDRPGDVADPFHTIFGLAGLSLLKENDLEDVDPVFCMTRKSLGTLSLC